MSTRSKKCKTCREGFVEIFVYKNGSLRRTRVLQCPNHCDGMCPRCDVELKTISISTISNERALECEECLWTGYSPDRELFNLRFEIESEKIKNREKLKLEHKLLREREKRIQSNLPYQLDDIEHCPNCHVPLKSSEYVSYRSISGFSEITEMLYCPEPICGNTWAIGTSKRKIPNGITVRDQLPLNSSVQICSSCGQPIRNGFQCGCS